MKVIPSLGSMVSVFVLVSVALADEESRKGFLLEMLVYSQLRTIEKFDWVKVVTFGDAEDSGLDSGALSEYLRLRFRNNFAGVELEKEARFGEDGDKRGAIHCEVFTFRREYPIAYHVGCQGGHHEKERIWHSAILGISNKHNLEAQVKKALSSMIEEFAIVFFKARGEL